MKTIKKVSKKKNLIPEEDDPQGQLMVYTPRTEEDRKFMSDYFLKLKEAKAANLKKN